MSNHSNIPMNNEQKGRMEKIFSGLTKDKENEISQIMNKVANSEGFGETKNFPEGKLTEYDEGEIKFGVTTKDEKVILNFGKPIAWIGMTRDQAKGLGRLLINRANGIRP